MIEATLIRQYTQWGVIGRLNIEGLQLRTIERPWLDNKPFISCIPEGEYIVAPYSSERYRNHWQLLNVENRTHILIHEGNKASSVQGCIAVGLSADIYQNNLWVSSSRKATTKMRSLLSDQNFKLTITHYRP